MKKRYSFMLLISGFLMLSIFFIVNPIASAKESHFQSTSTPAVYKVYLAYIGNAPTPSPTDTPLPPTSTPEPLPTNTPTPKPPSEPFSIDGQWEGTTSQGKEVKFSIVNRSLTSASIAFQIGGCGVSMRTNFLSPTPIRGNSFGYGGEYGGIDRYTVFVFGTFSSDTSAAGTLEVRGTLCGDLDATWTALKQ